MSEMLGNQYFLARKYDLAARELQGALEKDPKNKGIRKKLIICYSQIGQVKKALELFLSLIKEDIDFIIYTDPIDEDCPCPELVFDLEKEFPNNRQSKYFLYKLGMLWLYCNLDKSIHYFQIAQKVAPQDPMIKAALAFLLARKELEEDAKIHESSSEN